MDKASASGAGDSRFESWAGQTLPGVSSRSSGGQRLRAQVLNEVELPSPLSGPSKGSPRVAAPKPGGARSVRAQSRVGNGEVRGHRVSAAQEWPRDSDFAGVVPERSKSFAL